LLELAATYTQWRACLKKASMLLDRHGVPQQDYKYNKR
jgi:hypothetical protein